MNLWVANFAFLLLAGLTDAFVPPGDQGNIPRATCVDELRASQRRYAVARERLQVEAALATGVLVTSLLLGGAAAIPAAAGAAAEAASPGVDVARGATVFESNCAACHVGGQNAIAKERTLQREALEKYLGPDVDSERVRSFVRDGLLHRGALLFGGRVTDEEYADVSAYVVDQALGEKW